MNSKEGKVSFPFTITQFQGDNKKENFVVNKSSFNSISEPII